MTKGESEAVAARIAMYHTGPNCIALVSRGSSRMLRRTDCPGPGVA